MSKYSELIGSFIRRGNYPIEADYIFATEAALKEFYSDPIQNAILHKGLLKIVEDDGTGKQALYWVTKKQTNNDLEFTKLISGDVVSELTPKINEVISALQEEIKERQNGDSALWGTTNPTTIPEDLNSILDLSEAFAKLKEEFEEGSVGALEGLVNEAYYDADIESLVLVFALDNGKTRKLSIPFTNLIREWEPYNGHPSKVVELTREEVYSGGADKLSADVRISNRVDNILEKDGNALFVQGTTDNIDHNGTALNVVIRRLNKRIAALEKIIEECGCGEDEVVIPVSIISFESNCELINELGTTIDPLFTWTYNISTVDAQTLNNIAVDKAARSKQLTGINTDTKVTLFASYKGYTDTKELEFKFLPRVYFGANVQEQLYDVSGLPLSELGVDIKNANFDCSGGKYAYIAVPSQYKNSTKFYVNGSLEVNAYTTSTISVTSSEGKTMEYTLFKLDNFYYGQFSMDIKIE